MPTLSARAIKCVVVLDSHEVADTLRHVALDARVPITIEVDGHKLRCELSAKSVRKALATLQHAGPANVAVIIQGKLLADNTIADAGLVAQEKAPKPEPAAA
jgi:hypothetical protein